MQNYPVKVVTATTSNGMAMSRSASPRTIIGVLPPSSRFILGVTGIVGWVALDYRAHLQPGETVLILGAGGSAGQLAVQSARILGAGRVVGAARSGRALAADRGADAVVDLADDQAIDAGLAAAAPGGYDVIVDFLWGGPAPRDEPRERRRPVHPGRERRGAHVHDHRGRHPQQAAYARGSGHGRHARRGAPCRLRAADASRDRREVHLGPGADPAGRHQPDLGAPQDRAATQTRGHTQTASVTADEEVKPRSVRGKRI
jgi:hypothetical protein